ncbi:MAG: hypothetical protein K2G56_02195 [Eubacterium sp.]|nr:hypothetical protein [Eubacterium sp.]
MQKKSFSWGIIALMLILFFPIGIWMLVKKMTDEKFNYIKNGKSLKILAWILISFALIYLIMLIIGEHETEDGENILSGIILLIVLLGGGGAFALYKARTYIKKGTKYNRYVSIINNSNDTRIDTIAAAYPTTYEKAAKDIQSMINDGYFMNAYVDLNRRELIMPQNSVSDNATVNQNPTQIEAQPTNIECKNCGAINTVVPGTVNECEYCGSPL